MPSAAKLVPADQERGVKEKVGQAGLHAPAAAGELLPVGYGDQPWPGDHFSWPSPACWPSWGSFPPR